MKLFFSVSILSQIWIVVCKLIKVSNKSVEQFLFIVAPLQENQELLLDLRFGFEWNFPIFADIAEDSLHLSLVVAAQVLP